MCVCRGTTHVGGGDNDDDDLGEREVCDRARGGAENSEDRPVPGWGGERVVKLAYQSGAHTRVRTRPAWGRGSLNNNRDVRNV